MVKVLVNGAMGRMGTEVLKAVTKDKEAELVGAVDIASQNTKVASLINGESGLLVQTNLQAALAEIKPDVVVDFTRPNVVMDNLRIILAAGVCAVVGTTGFTEANLQELDELAKKNATSVLIAPNFSIGANLMLKLSEEAIKFLPKAEIIEFHHDQKLDAPSGTSILTAERLAKARGGYLKQGHPEEEEKLAGARGAELEGIPIHSVRLEGYVAHQEVIFGGHGETLIIRHDSNSRESFMPGVVYACKKMPEYEGLVYGLDKIMK